MWPLPFPVKKHLYTAPSRGLAKDIPVFGNCPKSLKRITNNTAPHKFALERSLRTNIRKALIERIKALQEARNEDRSLHQLKQQRASFLQLFEQEEVLRHTKPTGKCSVSAVVQANLIRAAVRATYDVDRIAPDGLQYHFEYKVPRVVQKNFTNAPAILNSVEPVINPESGEIIQSLRCTQEFNLRRKVYKTFARRVLESALTAQAGTSLTRC